MSGNHAITAFFPPVVAIPMSLDRHSFVTSLMGELASTLEDVVGPDKAAGFISAAGARVGRQINAGYINALAVPELPRARLGEVLEDVSRRTGSAFDIIEDDEDRIVLANRFCSCGENRPLRPGLCMLTANVFGVITAENLGYARVVRDRATVRGAPACRVVIHLTAPARGRARTGREYFRLFQD